MRIRRLGTPWQIGNAMKMVCSEEAGWITGPIIGLLLFAGHLQHSAGGGLERVNG